MDAQYLPDRKFLEFWGNLFLNLAKGQEQIEKLSSLMKTAPINDIDLMKFKEIGQLFLQSYGLASKEDSQNIRHRTDEPDSLKFNEPLEAFQVSLAKYAKLWEWVPSGTYEELKQNYTILQQEYKALQDETNNLRKNHEILKQQIKTQEELVSQLRDILNSKGMTHIEFFQNIQALTHKQTSEFQNLIQNLQNIFNIENINSNM